MIYKIQDAPNDDWLDTKQLYWWYVVAFFLLLQHTDKKKQWILQGIRKKGWEKTIKVEKREKTDRESEQSNLKNEGFVCVCSVIKKQTKTHFQLATKGKNDLV